MTIYLNIGVYTATVTRYYYQSAVMNACAVDESYESLLTKKHEPTHFGNCFVKMICLRVCLSTETER